MTMQPTDYRQWRADAATRDHAYRDAYLAGVADGRREHRERRQLVTVALVVGGSVLFSRVHVLAALAWIVVVVAVLWPVLLLGVVVELTIRQHRRHRDWRRTLAYVLTWLVGSGLVLLAVVHLSAWPLAGVVLLVGAWTLGPRARRWHRHGDGPGQSDGGRHSDWPPPEPSPLTDDDARPTAAWDRRPYRVTFTSKAQHRERRKYPDGHVVTLDTLTDQEVNDALDRF
ncbi:MAG TPA: hypothetical protein VND62_06320 [Acidimicrobiales bacterium]|nr:hypothetical protein [Acidimicrobiales bacterium]